MRALLPLMFLVGAGCAAVTPATRVATPGLRDVPPQTELREYEIQGSSAAELRAQLDLIGPRDEAGNRHDAYTRWHVKWSYPFAQTDAGCATGPVTITLTVSMDLPRWLDAEGGPEPLKARWQAYLDALVAHEVGHREHGVQAAAQIESALPLLPPQPSCNDAAERANAEGHLLLARFRQEDVDYDAATDHGATQGARFP